MGTARGVFAVKLRQMEIAYGQLLSRIQLCQEKCPEQLADTLKVIQDECRAHDILLEQRARASRLDSAAALAALQLEYSQKAKELCAAMEEEMRSHTPTDKERQAEAMGLCAEYAIDFATQSMRYALSAAIQAIEFQMKAEEKETERERCGELS